MIVQKSYECLLNLLPQEIYSGDIDTVVMNKLRGKYEKRCYNSGYINEVLEIEMRSMISIMKNKLDGSGSICVKFLTNSLIYEPGIVIPYVKILKITLRKQILGTSDNVDVRMVNDPNFLGLSVDDVVPVIIESVQYPTNAEKVIVMGKIFTVSPEPEIINLTGDYDESANSIIDEILADIEEIKAELDSVDKDVVKFFNIMLYPFKKPANPPSSFTKVSAEELIDMWKAGNDIAVCRHPNTMLSKDELYTMPVGDYPTLGFAEGISKVLLEYKRNLSVLINLSNIFATEQLIASNQKVWNMYKRNVKV